jgi:hypothetical protein
VVTSSVAARTHGGGRVSFTVANLCFEFRTDANP